MFAIQQKIFGEVELCRDGATFLGICDSPEVKKQIAEVRELTEEWHFENDPERKSVLKNKIDVAKKELPTFVPMATFRGTKRRQCDAVLNGLVFADYDDVPDPRAYIAYIFKKNGGAEKFCNENGILLIKVSAKGEGFHVVAKADIAFNIAENQDRLDYIFDRMDDNKHDEGCKDASRACYVTPSSEFLYINDELFSYENPAYEEKYGAWYRGEKSEVAEKKEEVISNDHPTEKTEKTEPTTATALSPATLFHGKSYGEIQEALWEKLGGKPSDGERHTKMMKMVCQLRYICDNQPEFIKSVLAPLPSPLPQKEIDGIVNRACQYTMYNQYAPKVLREVLDEMGISDLNLKEEDGGRITSNEANRRLQREFYPRFRQLQLPPFYQAIAAGVPDNLRIGMIIGSLPMTATMLTGIRFRHFDKMWSRLSAQGIVVGEAGSGKSQFKVLNDQLMEVFRTGDKKARHAEQQYKDRKVENKNKTKQDKKPHEVVRMVPASVSNSMLVERISNCKARPDDEDDPMYMHIYSFDSELDTVNRSNKGGSWIKKPDIYCKSFHDETYGVDYKNDESVNGEFEVHYNWLFTGTEIAFYDFINQSNVLSGLPDRLLLFPLASEDFQMLPDIEGRSDEEVALIKSVAQRLANFKETHEVDAQLITSVMYDWCKEKAEMARDTDDHELDKFRKRAALIGERAAVQYAIIENLDDFEKSGKLTVTQAAIEFGRFIADYTLSAQYMMFAAIVRGARDAHEAKMQGQGLRFLVNWHEILNTLPRDFNTADVINMYPDIPADNIRKQLQRLADSNKLNKLGRGQYQKKVA